MTTIRGTAHNRMPTLLLLLLLVPLCARPAPAKTPLGAAASALGTAGDSDGVDAPAPVRIALCFFGQVGGGSARHAHFHGWRRRGAPQNAC